jgi:drug/metabolite transporter (DMT)-like permease
LPRRPFGTFIETAVIPAQLDWFDPLMTTRAILYALLSAVLFGVSTPAAKALLGATDPTVLAGLFYCGAGVGVALIRRFVRPMLSPTRIAELALRRGDLPWLAGAIISGGIVGPVLVLVGLTRTDAATASLLLTLEGVATVLMAWFLFHENFDRRIILGMACLVGGAAALSWSGRPLLSNMLGPLAIVGACVAWGLDNNLTRKVSLSDPLQIVELKGLVAGPVNVGLGLWIGGKLPGIPTIVAAGTVGFLSYGVSLVLFVIALRHLGSARTSAYFSTAPFFGATAAILALGEPVTLPLLIAGALMGLGVWLHASERHQHIHDHEPMTHSHAHRHDDHHQHAHGPEDPPGEPHVHEHRHAALAHTHPHLPDMHHQHRH